MANVFDVTIAGIPLKLKTSHNEATVKELTAYVDRKFQEAIPLAKNGSVQSAALLASLNIAEDLIRVKEMARQELGLLEKRTRQVISELEASRLDRMGLDN